MIMNESNNATQNDYEQGQAEEETTRNADYNDGIRNTSRFRLTGSTLPAIQSHLGTLNQHAATLSLLQGQSGSALANPYAFLLSLNPTSASSPSSTIPMPQQTSFDSNLVAAAQAGLFGIATATTQGGLDSGAAGLQQQLYASVMHQHAFQQDHLLDLLRSSTNRDDTIRSVPNPSRLVSSSFSPWMMGNLISNSATLGSSSGADIRSRSIAAEAVRNNNPADRCNLAPASSTNSALASASSEDNDHKTLLLYREGDENSLTEYQCLLRKQLEIFEAGSKDVRSSSQGRNTPILLGQVGLRCRHCSSLPVAARTKGAIYFSQTIDGIYQIAQNMSKVHLCERCYRIPSDIQRRLVALRSDCRRASSGKEYWAKEIRKLGVYEDGRILRIRNKISSEREK